MQTLLSSVVQYVRRRPGTLAIGLPLILGGFTILTNGMVPFSNNGHCDPWHYFGYFYLDDQFAMMGQSRTYSRLPSTLLGFLLTQTFHSILADYAQYLILLVVVAGTVFYAAWRLFGGLAATVAAAFLATSGIVIGVLSVTYTGPALAWSTLASVAALASAAQSDRNRRAGFLIAAGFCIGAAVVGHLYSLTYNFIVPLYALTWLRARPKAIAAQLPSIAAYMLIGIVLSVVAFGLVCKFVLNSEFTFFRYQFLEVFNVKVTDYRKPDWYLRGGKAALIAIGLSLSLGLVLMRKRLNDEESAKVLAAAMPLLVLLLVQLLYTLLGGITVQYDYYYVWLLPPMALAIAAAIAQAAIEPRKAAIAGVAFVVLTALATLPGYTTFFPVIRAWPSLIGAAFVIVFFVALMLRPSAATLAAALICLAGFGVTVRPERMGVQVWELQGDGSAMYRRVRDGWEFLASHPVAERPVFWLATAGDMSETIAYPRGYEYCHIDGALPKFLSLSDEDYDPRAENFTAGKPLVMAVPDERTLGSALESLKRERGLGFAEIARHKVDSRGVSYWLVLGHMVGAAGK